MGKTGVLGHTCFSHRSAKTPLAATSSACEPASTISPFERTRMMSELTIVDSLQSSKED